MERRRKTQSTLQPPAPPAKLDRKTLEKNRRNRMNHLLQHLFSLIPPQHFQSNPKEMALLERLEQATGYLEQLRDRVERLKHRKAEVEAAHMRSGGGGDNDDSKLPLLKVMDLDGAGVQVILVTRRALAVSKLVQVLEDEGMMEVVGMNIVVVGDKVYYTLCAQVKIPRIGVVDTSRIAGRIHDFIFN